MFTRGLLTQTHRTKGAKVKGLCSAGDLTAIDPAVQTALAASIGTKPADVETADSKAASMASDLKAQYSLRDGIMEQLRVNLRQVRDALKSGLAPAEQFEICGFEYPFGGRSAVVAQIPSDLAVEGVFKSREPGPF